MFYSIELELYNLQILFSADLKKFQHLTEHQLPAKRRVNRDSEDDINDCKIQKVIE